MFDAEYFAELLSETLAMSDELSKSHSESLAEKVDANALALSYLAEKIEDDETREATRTRLRRFFRVDSSERTRTRARETETEDGPPRAMLEEDLLGYARKLREKAETLQKKLGEDEKVVEKAGEGFQRSVSQTRASISEAVRGKTLSSAQVFVLSLLVFVLVYALVRFF